MLAHDMTIGDRITVTNVAGRRFTGTLVGFKSVLGYIRIANDPRFPFSLFDAKVEKASDEEKDSVFIGHADEFDFYSMMVSPNESYSMKFDGNPGRKPNLTAFHKVKKMLIEGKSTSDILEKTSCSKTYISNIRRLLIDEGQIQDRRRKREK